MLMTTSTTGLAGHTPKTPHGILKAHHTVGIPTGQLCCGRRKPKTAAAVEVGTTQEHKRRTTSNAPCQTPTHTRDSHGCMSTYLISLLISSILLSLRSRRCTCVSRFKQSSISCKQLPEQSTASSVFHGYGSSTCRRIGHSTSHRTF